MGMLTLCPMTVCSESLSRLKGIETDRSGVRNTGNKSSESLSRLKGIETKINFTDCTLNAEPDSKTL